MTTRDEARVVHVFVEDQSVVLADDVHDWLKIIDDIEEMKMQYDTAQQRSFYWVRFKHAPAAQQAVNYLDGERLKNQVIHIRSTVYTKRTASDADAEENSAPDAPEKGETLVANPLLPLNHQMPSDLQVDVALVDCIPELVSADGDGSEAAELAQRLREFQETYCRVQEALLATEEKLHKADEEVVVLLRGNGNVSNDTEESSCRGGDSGETKREVTKRGKRIRNAARIPLDFFDPAGLVSKLTRYVGPVTDYCFNVSADGNSFHAIVEFYHENDAALALSLLTGHTEQTSNRMKRTRGQTNAEEALSPLAAFGWGEDASIDQLRPYDPSVILHAAHHKAMDMLLSCMGMK
ncbi:hypothetical protein DQ04_03441020 [Trypanosoma grayi]|uniref:hypothetical protein n=1 Tax=Trypanosoma grayi TaxID=71804 RepID=UPI0004F472A4|nr:hypothetical protein DQ04_03441020 [Trypanosoma grayi]KEG10665.1 hypothetical protein DQ04_03441020 [Trypanosoma grayi]